MTLEEFNQFSEQEKSEALTKCCGSSNWVMKMLQLSPFPSKKALLQEAENVWYLCKKEDWLEAFTHHPKIGDLDNLRKKFQSTSRWAEGEQSGVQNADDNILNELTHCNMVYEKKFGYIFIVCATGKSAGEMLEILRKRLDNDPDAEILIAMGEQMKITNIRLEKLLTE